MDHQRAIERILEFEDAFDATRLSFEGFHLWPYVRLRLWDWLLHPNRPVPASAGMDAAGLRKLAGIWSQQFFKLDVYLPFLQHTRRHRETIGALAARGPVDAMFFSRLEDHKDRFDKAWYNRHIDPMIEKIGGDVRSIKLELARRETEATRPRYVPTLFFDELDFVRYDTQRSLIEVFSKPETLILEEGAAFQKALAGTRFAPGLATGSLLIEAVRMRHYVRYFKDLLEALRPRVVFQVCYYYDLAMALNAACKALKIPSVDIQHGKQGKYHAMYTHWKQLPEEGYAVLPDYFWCWGDESMEHIERWLPMVQGRPKPIVGGNQWLAKWVEAPSTGLPLDPAFAAYADGLRAYEKTILVSLQPTEEIVPACLLEAIKLGPKTWCWQLRLHPRQHDLAPTIAAAFDARGIDNVHIEKPTLFPLYALLQRCDVHVTQWSSVCYEALKFGVKSVIIHPSGKTLFDSYIEKGYFVYADRVSTLLAALSSLPGSPVQEERPYIETRRDRYQQAIRTIMSRETVDAR